MSEELKGMTVNERLLHLGLFDDYDEAVSTQNETRLREVLIRCDLVAENVSAIVAQKIKKHNGPWVVKTRNITLKWGFDLGKNTLPRIRTGVLSERLSNPSKICPPVT
jgi:hypothetical protein